jgi:hypothetical protein
MDNYKFYLTFDVGIKNLAFCLTRCDITKTIIDGLDILEWGVIDVSHKPLICKHIVNKRKICNKISIFYLLKNNIQETSCHSNPDDLIGYCQNHASVLKLSDKKTYNKLFRISKNKTFDNSFNLKIERLLIALEHFYHQKISSIYHLNNTNNYLISNLEIYIENQPVFKNPIMKTISIAMFTFFTLKKITHYKQIKSVNFISASDKTHLTFIHSMNSLLQINPKPTINFKKYSERKTFAIDITNQIIQNFSQSIFNISSCLNYELTSKKDDMADALIYIIYQVLKQKIFT